MHYLYVLFFCVKSPNVQLACSTVNAPSLALQPAIASTSRRSARKSVLMAARVLVTPRSRYLSPVSVLLFLVVTWHACVFQLARFWMVIAVLRYPSVPVRTWENISHQEPRSLRTATPGEKAVQAQIHRNSYIENMLPSNKCLFCAVCVVTVHGNAPMKAVLVREMNNNTHSLILSFGKYSPHF